MPESIGNPPPSEPGKPEHDSLAPSEIIDETAPPPSNHGDHRVAKRVIGAAAALAAAVGSYAAVESGHEGSHPVGETPTTLSVPEKTTPTTTETTITAGPGVLTTPSTSTTLGSPEATVPPITTPETQPPATTTTTTTLETTITYPSQETLEPFKLDGIEILNANEQCKINITDALLILSHKVPEVYTSVTKNIGSIQCRADRTGIFAETGSMTLADSEQFYLSTYTGNDTLNIENHQNNTKNLAAVLTHEDKHVELREAAIIKTGNKFPPSSAWEGIANERICTRAMVTVLETLKAPQDLINYYQNYYNNPEALGY